MIYDNKYFLSIMKDAYHEIDYIEDFSVKACSARAICSMRIIQEFKDSEVLDTLKNFHGFLMDLDFMEISIEIEKKTGIKLKPHVNKNKK